MDSKVEIFKKANGDVEAVVTIGPLFIEKLHRQLEVEICERAATALAEKFIADKGAAIIACIDTKHVLNVAVAKVVTRISEESRK